MQQPRLSSVAFGLWVVALLGLISCSVTSPQVRQDRAQLERIRSLEQQARANPGNARAAIDYSKAVRNAWEAGVFHRCPSGGETDEEEPPCTSRPQEHIDGAVELLDRAAEVQNGDAPMVLAEKGVLFLIVDRREAGLRELEKSMELRPNFHAGVALIVWHGRQGAYGDVEQACERTFPHLERGDRQFRILELCVEHSGAASARGALDWASPEVREFYHEQKRKRRRSRQRQQRRRQAQQQKAKRCAAECKERRHLCLRDCRDERCENECQNAYNACLEKCRVSVGQ